MTDIWSKLFFVIKKSTYIFLFLAKFFPTGDLLINNTVCISKYIYIILIFDNYRYIVNVTRRKKSSKFSNKLLEKFQYFIVNEYQGGYSL